MVAKKQPKRRPTLTVRITDDFRINLSKKYWFIEVENYFWSQFASKHYKNITFREWFDFQLEPLKKSMVVHVYPRKKPDKGKENTFFAFGGWYDSIADRKRKKPIRVHIWFWRKPHYSRLGVKERFVNLLIKTVVHELNHAKQSRTRNYHLTNWSGDYYKNPDEIDSYALNSAQSLVARFGVDGARNRAKKFKTTDSHCSEFKDYFSMKDEGVRQNFIKKVLKYIGIYESYESEFGTDNLLCYRIKRHAAHSRRHIKKQSQT